MELSILIPVKNEENAISELVAEIKQEISTSYEIIIISDSQDKTDLLVNNISHVRLLTPHKDDLAQSVAYGIGKAKGTYICVMDGDGSHPPAIIPDMLEKSEQYDIVIGSRFKRAYKIPTWPWKRRLISFLARMTGYPILSATDNMSGFFLMKRSLAQKTPIKTKGYKILLEIAAYNKKCSIIEMPYRFRNRRQGSSKINAKVILHFFQSLPRLYYLRFFRL